MKQLILSAVVLALMSFAAPQGSANLNDTISDNTAILGGKITLINDTSEKVSVHTGSGSVTLNPRGGKTSFSCNVGKSVKADGKVIFKIDSDMCGKTIKLSEYL